MSIPTRIPYLDAERIGEHLRVARGQLAALREHVAPEARTLLAGATEEVIAALARVRERAEVLPTHAETEARISATPDPDAAERVERLAVGETWEAFDGEADQVMDNDPIGDVR